MLTWLQKNPGRALLLAALLIAGAVIALRSRPSSRTPASVAVKKGPISESVYGIGTVMANKSFQLKSGITATVLNIFVREGDQVKRGQRLATLDASVPFTAPFEGTIISAPVKIGENVFPQTIIVELVDLTDRYLVVSLEQRAAIRIRRGQKAKISFENLRDAVYEGSVESVYSHEAEFLVRIDVPSLPAQILPGMTADVAIGISERPDVLLVPVAAIENGQVLVKRGRNRPAEVPVKTGLVDGSSAEITSGDIQEGDQVFIRKAAP